MKASYLSASLVLLVQLSYAAEVYRLPQPGDGYTYFVARSEMLESGRIKVLSGKIGQGGDFTDFVEQEVDCQSNRYIELAGGSESGSRTLPSKALWDWSKRATWLTAADGSSAYDLLQFVCHDRD